MKAVEERYVIIGNGAAGTNACAEIRKEKPNSQIRLISAEKFVGYNRPMLTKGILSKVDNPNFNIKPESWYEENNIKLSLNTLVTYIDTVEKTVSLSNGENVPYDKLVLATGAESNIPNLPGGDLI